MYLQEIARRRIHLETEVRKLLRLLDVNGEAEVERGMVAALAQRSFGARYVQTLIDQARFAAGIAEPLDPVVTGNAAADNAHVTHMGYMHLSPNATDEAVRLLVKSRESVASRGNIVATDPLK